MMETENWVAAAWEGRERERYRLIVSVGDDEKALGRDSGDGLYNSTGVLHAIDFYCYEWLKW